MRDQTLTYCEEKEFLTSGNTDALDHTAKGDAYDAPWLTVQKDVNFAGGTAYKVLLQTSDTEAFTSAKTLLEKTFTPDEMNAGGPLIKQRVAPGMDRYTRVRVEVTGTGTAGKLSAFLTDIVSVG